MRNVIATMIVLGTIPTMASATTPPDEVVRLEGGLARGTTADGVLSWKGIPFAAPPTGSLRWRPPQPIAAWEGVRDASAYQHDCMQTPFPSDAAPLGTPPAEDCLYLNIWRPISPASNLPVVVWIYGGGFLNGGASPPTYSGANLAKQGVVFVSFNYRVGRFGTFAHPQISRENGGAEALGNYGFMDQLAALEWVRRNIGAFGGNAANVTIIGESAGGMSVHTLVTSPAGAGLFHKAIVMSGGDGGPMGDVDLGSAERIGLEFARTKGIAADDPQALSTLRALPADAVTDGLNMAALFADDGPRNFVSPFVDGKIAVDARQAYAAGKFARVPMMIGATSDDIGGATGMMVSGAHQAAAIISDTGVPVYGYRFSYVAESGRGPQVTGASHASEIPFFLHTEKVKYAEKTTSRDERVGRTVSAYIVNFAKTGDPNRTGLPRWPRYSRKADQIMIFANDGQADAQQDPLRPQLDGGPISSPGPGLAQQLGQPKTSGPHPQRFDDRHLAGERPITLK